MHTLPDFTKPVLTGNFAGLALTRPHIMGVLNVTPDSFSDGGKFSDAEAAAAHAMQLAEQGASILDIGGESTRPGADDVSVQEEIDRTIPVLEKLAGNTRAKLSIDTRKPEVMRAAARAGADMINDVSALTFSGDSLAAAEATGLPIILMHAQGSPKTMQQDPTYDDVVEDVLAWLAARATACTQAGIPIERIACDPGIGFGKTLQHNIDLLKSLSRFHALGTPLLLGASRKSFIAKISGETSPQHRLPGSLVAALTGLRQGVQFLRVHDVAETRQALLVAHALGEI